LPIAASCFSGDLANAVAPGRGPIELGSTRTRHAYPVIDELSPRPIDLEQTQAGIGRKFQIVVTDLHAFLQSCST